MIDVPSITRDRSLAVVELKPTRHSPATCKGWIPGAEDWHHTRGEFPRLGYFPDRELSPSRHCPSSSPQRCVCIAQPTHSCITSRPRCNGLYRGIDERWRTAVRVIFRKHANCLPGQIPRCARNDNPCKSGANYSSGQAPSNRRKATSCPIWYALWSATSRASRKIVWPSPHRIGA